MTFAAGVLLPFRNIFPDPLLIFRTRAEAQLRLAREQP
jgi:hypothetical protein